MKTRSNQNFLSLFFNRAISHSIMKDGEDKGADVIFWKVI